MYTGAVTFLPSTSTAAVGTALLFTDNVALMVIGAIMAVFGVTLLALQLVAMSRSRRTRSSLSR
jgi:hypothetical protein